MGVYAAFLVATMVAGAVVRFVPLELPALVVKYSGSALWAVCFYWLFRALWEWRPVWWAALAACLVTAGVEVFKLYRSPGVDAFRGTLPGVLLLGRYFSWWDVAAYWVGIAVAASVDPRLVRRPKE